MRGIIIVMAMLLFSSFAYARTNCPVAQVAEIQVEGDKVLYRQEGSKWRTLGYFSREDGTRERYSLLVSAWHAERRAMVAYRDQDYDCAASNYTESAYIVRVY